MTLFQQAAAKHKGSLPEYQGKPFGVGSMGILTLYQQGRSPVALVGQDSDIYNVRDLKLYVERFGLSPQNINSQGTLNALRVKVRVLGSGLQRPF